MLHPLRLQLKRTVRRIFWPRPKLYYPFGILRKRGNVFCADHELFISGFPRSGNTFAVKAFEMANPGVPLRSHKHIPAFIIQSIKLSRPGMVLIRNPIDAAISWSIFTREPLQRTLAYYNDYYSVLVPHRDSLFFVSFESVTEDFGKVLTVFNTRWETDYAIFQHTPENVAQCMMQIEGDYLDENGKVIEFKVPRPSAERRAQREFYLRQLSRPAIQKELLEANKLYYLLSPRNFSPRRPIHKTSTTQSIRLRPAM